MHKCVKCVHAEKFVKMQFTSCTLKKVQKVERWTVLDYYCSAEFENRLSTQLPKQFSFRVAGIVNTFHALFA